MIAAMPYLKTLSEQVRETESVSAMLLILENALGREAGDHMLTLIERYAGRRWE